MVIEDIQEILLIFLDIIVHKIDSIKWVLGLKEDLEVKDWDDRYINTLYVYKES